MRTAVVFRVKGPEIYVMEMYREEYVGQEATC